MNQQQQAALRDLYQTVKDGALDQVFGLVKGKGTHYEKKKAQIDAAIKRCEEAGL